MADSSTHIELADSEEMIAFLDESRKFDDNFRVEWIANLIYKVHYLGDQL